MPVDAVSVWPWTVRPVTTGSAVFTGGARTTTAERPVLAVAEATRFVAVTTAFSVDPTSAAPSVYDEAVAPLTVVQAEPPAEQRCHWNVVVIGDVPVHVPGVAERKLPSTAFPERTG